MIEMIKQGIDRNSAIFANITPGDYGKPSAVWGDVKTLMNHIIGGNHLLAMVGRGEAVSSEEGEHDFVGADPLGAYKESAEAAYSAWNTPDAMTKTYVFPFGEMPGPAALGTVLLEIWVHGSDLAKATGQDATIPAPLATALLAGLQAGGFDNFRTPEGNPFGPAVEVPEDASPSDKLLAFTGRTP